MQTEAPVSWSRAVRQTALVAALLFLPSLANALAVTRGPYLQNGSTTAVTIRWRTDTAADSRVRYGTSATALNLSISHGTLKTEHELRLTGLAANTRYYYSVGTATTTLAGGPDYFVVTAPAGAKPTRLWVLGDSGTANANQMAVRDSYYAFTGTRHTDLWLMLGDNGYNSGTDAEYQAGLFAIYPTMLRKSVLWPSLGNHDVVVSDSTAQTGPYFNSFTLPTLAEAGGVASGTEAYFSFDYGNIHFVALDTVDSDLGATAAQANWLRSDLQANTKDWLIAYFHVSPYSKGGHDSDVDLTPTRVRTNLVPILEQYGADLVLTGHSHVYERSLFIDGHYGVSSTFDPSTMLKQPGGGQGAGAYTKPAAGPLPHSGTVYTVAGSSGLVGGGTMDHPVIYQWYKALGSLVLDVDGGRLDASFLDSTGTVRETFTMIKGSPAPTTVTFQQGVNGYAGMTDSHFRSDNPTLVNGESQTMAADGNPDASMLVRWDLSSIPPGKTVTAVTVTFYVTNPSINTFTLYALKRDWAEAATTWTKATSSVNWGTAGAANTSTDRGTTPRGTLQATAAGAKTITLPAAGIAQVQAWVNNPATNYGFVIQDYAAGADVLQISTSENVTVANRPKITITYQ